MNSNFSFVYELLLWVKLFVNSKFIFVYGLLFMGYFCSHVQKIYGGGAVSLPLNESVTPSGTLI